MKNLSLYSGPLIKLKIFIIDPGPGEKFLVLGKSPKLGHQPKSGPAINGPAKIWKKKSSPTLEISVLNRP